MPGDICHSDVQRHKNGKFPMSSPRSTSKFQKKPDYLPSSPLDGGVCQFGRAGLP